MCSVGQKPTLVLLKYVQATGKEKDHCVIWPIPQSDLLSGAGLPVALWKSVWLEAWKRPDESALDLLSIRADHGICSTKRRAGKATGLVEWVNFSATHIVSLEETEFLQAAR